MNELLQFKQDLLLAVEGEGINKVNVNFVSYEVAALGPADYPALIANPPRSRNPQREDFKFLEFTIYLLDLDNSEGSRLSEDERLDIWSSLETKWNKVKAKMTPPRYIFVGDDIIEHDDNLHSSGDLFIEIKTTIRVSKC